MAKPGVDESSPTEALLQNLLKRPDVRSTLILSRKDGSIIKAAGLIAKGFDDAPTESTATVTDVAKEREDEQDLAINTSTAKEPGTTVSAAQLLASSIFHFVASAASLSTSLKRAENTGSATVSVSDQNTKEQQADDKILSGDGIQLLRLRMAKQEVIIFPDPKYICCVIQDLDKDSR